MFPIPANATRIRYLESTGTQYVDTGVDLVNGDTFALNVDGRYTSLLSRYQLMGVYASSYFGTSPNNRWIVAGGYGLDTANADTSRHAFTLRSTIGGTQTSYLTIDGASYSRSRTNNAGRMYLLNIPASGQTWTCAFAVYSARLTVNGTLVRSYVPVRVGQVGYLFDRVSGQLFGNAGTGDFTLGPDTFQQGVVPTRMMVAGVRKKLPTSLDYVQDGLYYQLDGIENAGRGVHSATATTWTDLTGNGRDATFINGKTWKDNACYFAGMTSDHMAKIRGLPSMTAFTFEVVHKLYSWEIAGRVWDTEAYIGGTEGKRFYGFCNIDSLKMDINIANHGSLLFSDIPVNTSAKSIAVVPTTYSTTVAPYVYMNGLFVGTQHSSTVRAPSTMTYIDIANRSNNPNRGLDMDVYAIRVYNRVLTADEIAHNYAIDKARFNLP